MIIKRLIYIVCIFFLLAFNANAATLYVTQVGAGDTDGSSCANAISIATFNSSASGGNTYVVCSGETITTTIAPPTGSEGSVITLISEWEHDATGSQYDVEVTTSSYGVNLTSKFYITIDGLYFNDCGSRWINLSSADHNVFQNNKFYDAAAWAGIQLANSDYNQFIDNVFEDAPLSGDANGTKPADLIYMTGTSNHNLFSGNTFGKSAHDSIMVISQDYNVFRGNTVTNHYHVGININDPGPNLIESNLFYDNGTEYDSNPESATANGDKLFNGGIQLNGASNIIRKNIFDTNGSSIDQSQYNAGTSTDNNRIYNNTMNDAVRVINVYSDYGAYTIDDNIYKNNTFTNSYDFPADGGYGVGYELAMVDQGGTGNRWYNNVTFGGDGDHKYDSTVDTLANIVTAFPTEFPSGNTSVDPKYTDADNRDFTLQSDSTLIDGGAWLTTITTATGSGTTFTVADAQYFYDGWGISGETGDVIKTENGQTATITSVNYGTGQIIVSSSMSWVQNEGIALDYNGTKPDIGAEEYGGASSVSTSDYDPANTTTGVPMDKALGWTNADGVTDIDIRMKVKSGACDLDAGDTIVDGGGDIETVSNADLLTAFGVAWTYSEAFCWEVIANPDVEAVSSGQIYFTLTGGPPIPPSGLGMCVFNINAGDMKYNANAGDKKF